MKLTEDLARSLMRERGLKWREALKMADQAHRCGARAKHNGGFCQRRPVPGRSRCKHHGGKSTGARTEEGRQKLKDSARSRVTAQWQPGGIWYHKRRAATQPASTTETT